MAIVLTKHLNSYLVVWGMDRDILFFTLFGKMCYNLLKGVLCLSLIQYTQRKSRITMISAITCNRCFGAYEVCLSTVWLFRRAVWCTICHVFSHCS